MRFFTDNFFTLAQKKQMLGSGYDCHVEMQLREQQLEAVHRLRQNEAALALFEQQNKQHDFQRNIMFSSLMLILLTVVLVSLHAL